MEESGHYYTVYITSLAAGFSESMAYQHAVLAQMPDEVTILDAAHLHKHEAIDRLPETNTFNQWRYLVEFAQHSLPSRFSSDVSSSSQRRMTRELLSRDTCAANSIEFGLLLHRLGDTFAHSTINNQSRLYTVTPGNLGDTTYNDIGHFEFAPGNHGHMQDSIFGTDPDNPWNRPRLFFRYLGTLYNVLWHKLNNAGRSRAIYSSGRTPYTYFQLERVFKEAFRNLSGLTIHLQQSFINNLRRITLQRFGIMLRNANASHQPELNSPVSLAEFLAQHPEINTTAIEITDILLDIYDSVRPRDSSDTIRR